MVTFLRIAGATPNQIAHTISKDDSEISNHTAQQQALGKSAATNADSVSLTSRFRPADAQVLQVRQVQSLNHAANMGKQADRQRHMSQHSGAELAYLSTRCIFSATDMSAVNSDHA